MTINLQRRDILKFSAITSWSVLGGTPEFDSYFWAKARPALSLSPKNFYRQYSLNVALYDIIKSISVLEGDNASARFNRFG